LGSSLIEVHTESRAMLIFCSQYAKVAHFNTTHLRRQSFYALPRAHLELLAAPPFSYLDTLNAVDDAIDKNAELSLSILNSGLKSFGIPPLTTTRASGDGKDTPDWRDTATSNDLEKARSTLRQFYRDWSEEGSAERAACYGPVINALLKERLERSSTTRVLVPGAGLGRLVFELCSAGFDAEGNEISYHQLLASSYILNHCPEEREHTVFPWVHSFSNHRSRANHLKSVKVPDVHPGSALGGVGNAGEMSMSASDFLCLYGNEDHRDAFDAVATVFFLDTAPNIIRYIEVIHNCLRPGGLLVNNGPLLWHFENNAPGTHGRELDPGSDRNGKGEFSTCATSCLPLTIRNPGIADPGSMELTDDEVVVLIEKLGFDIEKRESGISAPYIQDPESMLQNTFRASYWVARKRGHV
jgi:carnosine N-methyltransferase